MTKTIKKTTLSIVKLMLFLSLAIPAAHAQQKTEDVAKKMTDNLKEQLALNDTQYKQVYDANVVFINQAKAVKTSGEGKIAKGKKLKAADETRDTKLKGVLTDSQYKKFLEKKKENREKFKEWYKENH
jgi:hypothetical protein